MSESTEWPTEGRLAELREGGVVPYSPLSARLAAAAVVLGVFAALAAAGSGLVQQLREVTPQSLPNPPTIEALTAQWNGTVLKLLLFPALAAAAIIFAWGLLQTGFLFRFSQLTFNLARLNHFRIPQLPRFLSRVLMSAGAITAAVLLGMFTVRLLSRDLFRVFHGSPAEVPLRIGALTAGFLPIAAAFAGFAAVGVYFIDRYRFSSRHRMTRAEVDAESRDEKRA